MLYTCKEEEEEEDTLASLKYWNNIKIRFENTFLFKMSHCNH